ncbi:MAG: DUF5615 family PIN-like protein [Gammaproteobacteria bacterium]
MKLLLDESLPRGLRRLLSDHTVITVQERGWAGVSNGKLLRLAEREFDAFLTADQNLQYQQNLVGFEIAVFVLAARTTRLQDLTPLVPNLLAELRATVAGQVIRIAL